MRTFKTSEGFLLDWRIRQRMAPAMARILEFMEAHPDKAHADNDIAAVCFVDRGNAKHVLNKLHDAGILRIAGYRRTGSTPQALYGWACMGKGDAKPLKARTNADRQRTRRESLKKRYGEYAWRVHTSRKGGGVETLVIEGKVVYRRRPA